MSDPMMNAKIFAISRRPSSWMGMGLALAALLCLAPGTAAQDNDDDGVLPSLKGGGELGSTGGGAAGNSGPADVTVSGEIMMTPMDDDQASVRVRGFGSLAFASDPNHATMAAAGEPIRADLLTSIGDLHWQGQAMVSLQSGLDVEFVAAPAAVHRMSVLMAEDGSSSLDEILAGNAQPALLLRVGDVQQLDLNTFRNLVIYHAGGDPDVYITWVFAAVDAEGVTHLSAVRASGDGQLVEVSAK